MSQLAAAEKIMTAMPQPACSGRIPARSRRIAATMSAPPISPMVTAWASPARLSTFPWPYGCAESAGAAAIRSEKRFRLEMTTSRSESAAADTSPIDPMASPVPSFSTARPVAPPMARRSARSFARVAACDAGPPGGAPGGGVGAPLIPR